MEQFARMERRQFLAGTAAVAVIAAMPWQARAEAPKRGGHFKYATADFATTDSLDPALSETRYQLNLNWQIRNNLAEVNADNQLVPELAESWEGSSGAKTWTIKLRKGVQFHNGKDFKAPDVVYSLNLHRAKNTHSPIAPLFTPITDIKPNGDYEVVITLSEGNVGFPDLLAHYSVLMVPDGETAWAKGVGTGPYVLETFEPGVRSLAKRNPNYWKQGRAHFNSVELIGIKDATSRSNALVSGEIHAYNFVDLKTVELVKQQPGVEILRVPSKAHYTFPMLMDAAPFTNKDVREAMKLAINREEMLTRILNGYGKVGNDQPLNEGYKFYNPNIPQRSYDPDKAKFHLKQAGQSGLSVQLFVSETPFAGATDAAVLYKEHAAPAGINIEVVKTPEDGYWSDIWFKKPFCAARWSGRINADVMLSTVYSSDGIKTGWNETHMSDPRVDKLLVEARTEADEAKRAELYGEIQRIIHDDGGQIAFCFADFVDAASDKLGHDKLAADWDLDGGRAAERWWFK